MANKRNGQVATTKEWRKHLRKHWKRHFWKTHRRAEKDLAGDKV